MSLTFAIAACATGPNTPDDGTTVRAEVGQTGCSSCNQIHTFTSKTLASQLYAVRDSNNSPTGQRISASLKLGISNRNAGVAGGLSAAAPVVGYLATITGVNAHFFEGETHTDANHPYRFLLRIHHNSSFEKQDVQLVEDGKFQSLPVMHLDGVDDNRSCFNSGCLWDADYVISAKVVNSHIAEGTPLTVFVGYHGTRQVQSKDGLNASFETVNSGVFLQVSAEQLRNFVTTVHRELIGS